MRKILRIVLPFLAMFAFFTATAFAQSSADTSACGSDALEQLFCSTSLSQMLNTAFQLSITLGGVLAMLRIGYGGWLYMGRGEDMWSTKQHAKDVFRDAIIGLLLLLAIYLILYQINPDILSLKLVQDVQSAPPLTSGSQIVPNAAAYNGSGAQDLPDASCPSGVRDGTSGSCK